MNQVSNTFEFRILRDLPIGCCILNSDMEIVLWNSMLETWTGQHAHTLVGQNIYEAFPHLRKPRYANRLHSVLESGSPAIFSSAFTKRFFTTCADYAEQAQQCTATRIHNEQHDQHNHAISITINDVSEQYQRIQQYKNNAVLRAEHEVILTEMNKRLENNNTYLDEFAHIVSHDLKAPLRNIHSLLSWLIEDLGDDLSDDIRDYSDKLQNTVSSMSTLINSLLSYARAGREQGDIEIFRLDELCENILNMQDVPDHIQISHHGTDCTSTSSKLLLGQVIGNILSNAIKYNDKDQGIIKISVSQSKLKHLISVTDNGPGIDEKYHKKIFQIFQKAHHDTRQDSTGIGLALVKKIVENQGGAISITSEIGAGSEFTFTWPV